MALSKKTTILFPPALHAHLIRIAKRKGTSLGDLIRQACEERYGTASSEERLKAVEELFTLSLPVGSPADMKRESVPPPDELLP